MFTKLAYGLPFLRPSLGKPINFCIFVYWGKNKLLKRVQLKQLWELSAVGPAEAL